MSIIIIAILESQSALGLYFIVLFLVYSFHCLSLHCKVRMFFIPSCPLGWRMIVSLSVPRTLRSVWIGSLEPLRGTRMVCCMYYTDVFVGSNDIDKLKNALKAELGSSVLNDDLTQLNALADGLGSFIGYGPGGRLTGNGIGNINGGSYDSSDATWEKLCEKCQCKSVSKSCSNCSCSSGSQTVCSDPSKCCDNCDLRKAAKIFLGMLPCLYYALKYLYKQCNGGWKTLNISNKDYSLGRFFVGMGYDVGKLNGTKTGGEISGLLETHIFNNSNPLEKLYEKSKNYFTSRFTSLVSPSDSTSPPKTVREILLWLSGLPFTSGFKDLLKHCEGLCKPVENSVKFIDFETSLFNSCFLLPVSVLTAIERPGTSEVFPSEAPKFFYPSDPFDLLDMLFENVRKVFVPLKFLCMQCELEPARAGWRDCYFGKSCTTTGKFSSSCCSTSAPNGYLCDASGHSKHCDENGKCINTDSAAGSGSGNCHTINNKPANCKPCPHPLLMFLVDGSSDSQSQSPSSPFRLPSSFARLDFSQTPPAILDASSDKFLTMGFSKSNLPTPARKGKDLYAVLKVFCDSSSTPLTSLLRSLVCISRTPPDSLGELFGFFKKFKNPSVFKSQLLSWIQGEPGIYNGQNFTNALKDALETLKGSSHSSSHSGDHSVASLYSLNDCEGPRGLSPSPPTCGAYLNSLTGDIYKDFIEDSPGLYLSWICYLPKDFKTLLEEFKEKFSSCCSSGSSCTKIVECPCILPKFYKYGFTFMKASTLNDNNKKCSDFIAQLGNFLGTDSTLLSLIAEIEAFLWSIRLPFFFGFLYVWFFVLSYFCYVILIKLDTFHTGSHLHLPRSFKILPSTLFSDASSKLKDLSYFTL
ncbi:variant erythrocyte surface antigen-1 family protein [Babesia divergens]|uniref:Variant erythrocyte surface antigen-1 family protein n=1 Tax=Babesia divergens TaxID=32595 RepID=A0AAD9LG69_BABDI|nr:variant erythrocyte surface antigen-1 family protein [Babesia divergens]